MIALALLLLWAAAGPAAAEVQVEVAVGKSVVLDSPANIVRVSVANGDLAEAVAVSPRELLINGKAPGETSLILWAQGGGRTVYNVRVEPAAARLEAVRRRLARELPNQPVEVSIEGNAVFLSGTVRDAVSAGRAAAIAGVLGKPVNLLRVAVPAADAQILLKVRFANVDQAAERELGANLLSTGALNTVGGTSTGSFTPPKVDVTPGGAQFSISDALNIFLFRPDLNLGATIRALASRRLLEILAEPNVLAIDGKPASFVSGGEFPFPTLQGGGAGLGAVTIQFREFGVRINFLPVVTPRGTIRLQVAPEVSSLDFANGLVFQGFHIPALATRRVQTEVELASGQSFVIAGLLDNRLSETISKIPGLGDIPLLGKIFQSQTRTRNHSQLLVLVTPELVVPIPAGGSVPEVAMPQALPPGTVPRTPGGAPPLVPRETVPVEKLNGGREAARSAPDGPAPAAVEFVPVPLKAPAEPK